MPFMNNIKELCLVPGKAFGDIASFEAAAAPLVSCICTINPVQSGSGDPSPSNIRLITGHDDVTITQKDGNNTIVDTTTITFPDTVYGGSLDVGSGVLTIDRAIVDLNRLFYTYYEYGSISGGYSNTLENVIKKPTSGSALLDSISDKLVQYSDDEFNSSPDNTFAINAYGRIKIHKSGITNATELKNALSGYMLVYPLATPTTTQLTPEQLNSILGNNNFYHDGNGTTDITYIRRVN